MADRCSVPQSPQSCLAFWFLGSTGIWLLFLFVCAFDCTHVSYFVLVALHLYSFSESFSVYVGYHTLVGARSSALSKDPNLSILPNQRRQIEIEKNTKTKQQFNLSLNFFPLTC